MGDRGSVHAYRAAWTEPDPDNPGQRRKRFAKTWTYRFNWRGERYVGGDGYATKREALNAGETRKAEVKKGLEVDPLKTTFVVLDRLLEAKAAVQSKATGESTLFCLARLRKVFKPGERLAEIKRMRIEEAVAQLRALGLESSTVRLTIRRLKFAMDVAQEEGLMLSVPKFPTIKVDPRQETIHPHELEAILSHLPEYWMRYYVIADETGWRGRSELRSRQWTDVVWDPGWLLLDKEHSKTKKDRKCALTELMRSVLTEQRQWVEAVQQKTGRVIPWVFCQPSGEPLGEPVDAWSLAVKAAGFGKLKGRTGPWSSAKVPHDIRRSALRRWKATGERIDVTMDIAGHDSTETHAGYTRGDEASLIAFAKRRDEERRNRTEKVTPIRKG